MTSASAHLVRHGETEWSLSGRHTGRADLPLTAKGREDAQRLGPALSFLDPALVLTSPLARARETCERAGLGRRAEVDPDLMEWDYGDFEGRTAAEIRAVRPGWVLFADGCPGGESPEAVVARVDRVIARIRAAQGDVVLFAHGHLSRVLAVRWLGLPTSAASHFLLDTATTSVLAEHRGIPVVRRWNVPVAPASVSRADLPPAQGSGASAGEAPPSRGPAAN